jgi:hypothetical protein
LLILGGVGGLMSYLPDVSSLGGRVLPCEIARYASDAPLTCLLNCAKTSHWAPQGMEPTILVSAVGCSTHQTNWSYWLLA